MDTDWDCYVAFGAIVRHTMDRGICVKISGSVDCENCLKLFTEPICTVWLVMLVMTIVEDCRGLLAGVILIHGYLVRSTLIAGMRSQEKPELIIYKEIESIWTSTIVQ